MLMHDNATSACWCIQVDCKEAKPEIVAWMDQNLVDAGYAGMRVTLKSDGGPVMKALKRGLALKRDAKPLSDILRRGNPRVTARLNERFRPGKVR